MASIGANWGRGLLAFFLLLELAFWTPSATGSLPKGKLEYMYSCYSASEGKDDMRVI
jgi:hypothetical protein